MDGLHCQGVAEHERDAFGRADIGDPIQGEHALDRHHQSVAVERDDLEECLRRRWHVPVHKYLTGAVEDADVHRLHVEIDPAPTSAAI